MASDTRVRRNPRARSGKPDLATFGGMLLAFGGILGGLLLEGGSVMDVTQITAAMIVLGGTIGAVMITTPVTTFTAAARKLPIVFFDTAGGAADELHLILDYASRARKSGLVSLEQDLPGIANPFLQKALSLSVDGTDLKDLREIMEVEIQACEHEGLSHAKVFEAAGGYAPTIGIIGAVLGLIQVMKHLENIDEVGKGIAVAFVATVYGVGIANLFFLPAAAKIKARVHQQVKVNEMLLEGVCSIVEGMNPKMIALKLEPFVPGWSANATAKKAAGAVSRAATAA
jgi:chemotaxis protein MotA